MLVDKKFYYISLPRCGSTSFHFTCLRQGIPIQTLQEDLDLQHQSVNIDHFTNEELSNKYQHTHEPLITLQENFGDNYPIIAVRRDRHETFISLWKHIVDHVKLKYGGDLYEKFSKLTIDDILFFAPLSLSVSGSSPLSVSYSEIQKLAAEFLKRNNLEWKEYLANLMTVLYTPKSLWHGNHRDIIWFDFDKLNEMEDWISSKLERSFKLENYNTSKHIESNVKLDNYFKSKYNLIYNIHDIKKSNKTLV
jgi:hypothetical protein